MSILINEEIAQIQSLKPKNDLNTRIWNKDNGYRLFPHIRQKLINTAEYYKRYIDLDQFGLENLLTDHLVDIIFIGSLANYNWSEFSDIDLHLVIDFSNMNDLELTILKAYLYEKKSQFAETHDIKVFGYDLEMYVQDSREDAVTSGQYSVLYDKWVKFPEKITRDIKWEEAEALTQSYKDKIDDLEMPIDFGSLKNHDTMISTINEIWRKIKNGRKAGLANEGEYAIENLVFKAMRRNGYMDKLLGLRAKLIDDKLSVRK